MADIRYTAEIDGSKMTGQIRAEAAAAARASGDLLDDIVLKYERLRAAQAKARRDFQRMASGPDLLDDLARPGRFVSPVGPGVPATPGGGGGGGGGPAQVAREYQTLGDRIRTVNRLTTVWMRLGTAAGGGLAASYAIATTAAERYERRMTEANHATAATTREVRALGREFDESMRPAVGMFDGIGAAIVRTTRDLATFRDEFVDFIVNGAEEANAKKKARAGERSSIEASILLNSTGDIGLARDAQLARIRGDSIEAAELERRIAMRQVARQGSIDLREGKTTPGGLQARLDATRAVEDERVWQLKMDKAVEHAAELGSLAREQAEQERRDQEENARAALDSYEALMDYRARKQQEIAAAEERSRQAALSTEALLRGAEIDADLESSRGRVARLRRMGLDREADEEAIRGAFGADRARAMDSFGEMMARIMEDPDLPDDRRLDDFGRAQAALARVMNAMDQQEMQAVAALSAREDDPRRSRDAGQGLIVSPGASDVVKGRVFGMPSERQAQRDQLAEAKKSAKLLERIEANTRQRVGTYGP